MSNLFMLAAFDEFKENINAFLLTIDQVIYKFTIWIYEIFVSLANARLFSEDSISKIFYRIYLVIGVVMLFVLAYSLLRNIIDPEGASKNKENPTKVIMNIVISLALVAVIPQIFNFAYNFQSAILNNNVIGKLFFKSNSTTDTSKVNELSYAGGEFVAPIVRAFLYTDDFNGRKVCQTIECELCLLGIDETTMKDIGIADNYCKNNGYDESAKSEYYIAGVEEKTTASTAREFWGVALIEKFQTFKISGYSAIDAMNQLENNERDDYINQSFKDYIQYRKDIVKGDYEAASQDNFANSDYGGFLTYGLVLEQVKANRVSSLNTLSDDMVVGSVKYSWPLTLIAGLFMLYLVFSFSLDMALRLVKLGFYQLISPIPIMAKAIPGKASNMFSEWGKITLTTYFEVIIRLLTINFGVYALKIVGDTKNDTPLWNSLNYLSPVLRVIAIALIVMGIVTFMKKLPEFISKITGIDSKNMSLGIKDKLLAGGAFTAAGVVAGTARSGANAMTRAGRNADNKWKNAKSPLGKAAAIVSGVGGGVVGTITSGINGGIRGGISAKDAKGFREGFSKGSAGAQTQIDRAGARTYSGNIITRIANSSEDNLKKFQQWSGATVVLSDKTRKDMTEVNDIIENTILSEINRVLDNEIEANLDKNIAAYGTSYDADLGKKAKTAIMQYRDYKREYDAAVNAGNAVAMKKYQTLMNDAKVVAQTLATDIMSEHNDIVKSGIKRVDYITSRNSQVSDGLAYMKDKEENIEMIETDVNGNIMVDASGNAIKKVVGKARKNNAVKRFANKNALKMDDLNRMNNKVDEKK
ncbi:MAG: hypothetical protein IJ574_01260 [Bacilli bacterium]|nr:hypothetical protein [Bacilli bacterium]